MKTINQIIREVNLLEYVEDFTGEAAKKVGNKTWRINPCPVCGGKDHFTITFDKEKNHYYYHSFSDCCKGGTIIQFVIEVEKAASTVPGVLKHLNYPAIPVNQKLSQEDYTKTKETSIEVNFMPELEELTKNRTKYYNNRGLSFNLIRSYNLGYHEQGMNHMIKKFSTVLKETASPFLSRYRFFIPIVNTDGTCNYFITRIDETTISKSESVKQKNHNLKGYPMRVWNDRYLFKPSLLTKQTVFIVEGVFDALSFEEIGYSAMALNSSNNTTKLDELLTKVKHHLSDVTFVICADNDAAGKQMEEKLLTIFKSHNLYSISYQLPKMYKDANDFLVDNREAFEKHVKDFFHKNGMEDTVLSYLEDFAVELVKKKYTKVLSTSFSSLDQVLGGGLQSGLYVLGAISSLGKTTFVQQMTDHIAHHGQDVLFFSLEMSKFELVTKSLSRYSATLNNKNLLYSQDMMKGHVDEDIFPALIKAYTPAARHLSIIEDNFEGTINSITDKIDKHVRFKKQKPVVVIDYLQILKPVNERLSDKQAIDRNVTEIKKISRKYNIPIILISSFNRESYTSPISFEAFKESGAIEYSADVILGLQLAEVHDVNPKNRQEARNKLNHAKNNNPRNIELVILKNRHGQAFSTCSFKYYPQLNLFKEDK